MCAKYLLFGRLEAEISFKSSVYVILYHLLWEVRGNEDREGWAATGALFRHTLVLGSNFGQGLCFAKIFIHYIPYAQLYNRASCNFDWPVMTMSLLRLRRMKQSWLTRDGYYNRINPVRGKINSLITIFKNKNGKAKSITLAVAESSFQTQRWADKTCPVF